MEALSHTNIFCSFHVKHHLIFLILTISGMVFESISCYIKVFPDNQYINCSHLHGLQRVIHTKTVFACILWDFIKVSTWKQNVIIVNKGKPNGAEYNSEEVINKIFWLSASNVFWLYEFQAYFDNDFPWLIRWNSLFLSTVARNSIHTTFLYWKNNMQTRKRKHWKWMLVK